MKKILITRKLITSSEELATKFFDVKENINIVARAKVPLKTCENSEIIGFRTDLNGKDHFAIIFNEGNKNYQPLVRIHSQCISYLFHSALRVEA